MSSSKRDYYEVLIISRTASQDDVKQAFRKLAKEHHPDRTPGDAAAEDKFKEIQEAFSILHDAEKRRRYDRMGHAAFGGDPRVAASGGRGVFAYETGYPSRRGASRAPGPRS